jgi:hypothetical protein
MENERKTAVCEPCKGSEFSLSGQTKRRFFFFLNDKISEFLANLLMAGFLSEHQSKNTLL